MVDFLGPDYFGTAISVGLEGCRTGGALRFVARLHRLESLCLFMADLTDEQTSYGFTSHISSKGPNPMLDNW